MDNSMRFAALRALENAEQAAKERHAVKMKHLQEMMEEQTEEVKSILFAFIRTYGKDFGIEISEETQDRISLVDTARLTMDAACLMIDSLRQKSDADEIAALKQENARLKQQLAALCPAPVQTHNMTIEVVETSGEIIEVTRPAPAPAAIAQPAPDPVEATPLPDGSLEDQILCLAGVAQFLLVPNLVSSCAKKLNVDPASIEAGVSNLVTSGHIATHKTNRFFKNGREYPAAFSITPNGAELLRQKGQNGLVNAVQRLSALNQIALEEMPLLGYFVEEVLLRHGYTQAQYAPEITIPDANGIRAFTPHVLLSLYGDPVYLMYLGEKYVAKGITPYYRVLFDLTKGPMHFLCLNPRTARTIQSDITYLTSGNAASKPDLHISNVDDLEIYESLVKAGQIKPTPKSIWFGSMRNKRVEER